MVLILSFVLVTFRIAAGCTFSGEWDVEWVLLCLSVARS